jgi:uncharacterized protein
MLEQIIQSTIGGLMIGAAAAGTLLIQGKIAGISGIVGGVIRGQPGAWRWTFIAGLITAGVLARLGGMTASPRLGAESILVLVGGGFLVGLGTRLGNGCTSGHGVCGLGNLSPRSAVAVATFMATGAMTVYVVRHVLVAS